MSLENRAKHAGELLQERLREAGALNERELEGWKTAGTLVAELLRVWLETIVPAAEERDLVYYDALRSGLLTSLGEEAEKELSRATNAPVQPFPSGFRAFRARLVELTLDPGRLGSRDLSRSQWLVAALPDLRGQDRSPQLSGRVERMGG